MNTELFFGNEERNYGDSLKNITKKEPQKLVRIIHKQVCNLIRGRIVLGHIIYISWICGNILFFGLNVTPLEMSHDMKAHVSFDPYNVADFDIIVKTVSHCRRWL
jgi:hypothetical protein